MANYLTAKEIGAVIGRHENTVYSYLIEEGLVERLVTKNGFKILNKGKMACCYVKANGKRIVKFDYDQVEYVVSIDYQRRKRRSRRM